MDHVLLRVIYFSPRSGSGKAQTPDRRNVKIHMDDVAIPNATLRGVQLLAAPTRDVLSPWAGVLLRGTCVQANAEWLKAESWVFDDEYRTAEEEVWNKRRERNRRRNRRRQRQRRSA